MVSRQNLYHRVLVKTYSFTWLVIRASISFFESGAFPKKYQKACIILFVDWREHKYQVYQLICLIIFKPIEKNGIFILGIGLVSLCPFSGTRTQFHVHSTFVNYLFFKKNYRCNSAMISYFFKPILWQTSSFLIISAIYFLNSQNRRIAVFY